MGRDRGVASVVLASALCFARLDYLLDVFVLVETKTAVTFGLLLDAHPMEVVAALEHLDGLLVQLERSFAVVAGVVVAGSALYPEVV